MARDQIMSPPERIVLGDILVRRWTLEDAVPLHTAVTESFDLLHPWMPWASRRPEPGDQQAALSGAISRWDAGEAYIYGIFATEDGRLLGTIGLEARPEPGAFEIGYWLHTDHTGKGVATRAAAALTAIGLALPGTERVEIRCDRANTASAAVPERLGYHLDRIEPAPREAPGETGHKMIWIKHTT